MTINAIPAYVRRLSRSSRSSDSSIRGVTLPKDLVDAWEKRYGAVEEVEIHIDGEDIVLRPVKGQEPLDAAE